MQACEVPLQEEEGRLWGNKVYEVQRVQCLLNLTALSLVSRTVKQNNEMREIPEPLETLREDTVLQSQFETFFT